MRYDVSIRITFPEAITNILQKEKQRFVTHYGSRYKSEPHITLYLDSYTAEGYPKLLQTLRELRVEPFTISLLEPMVRVEQDRHRNLYILDVSNKPAIHGLHDKISNAAIPYRSPFIRERIQKELESKGIRTDGLRENLQTYQIQEEPFDPHITLGEIDFDKPQADIGETQKNLSSIVGTDIIVSSITLYWYGKEESAEKASLLEEITISFTT